MFKTKHGNIRREAHRCQYWDKHDTFIAHTRFIHSNNVSDVCIQIPEENNSKLRTNRRTQTKQNSFRLRALLVAWPKTKSVLQIPQNRVKIYSIFRMNTVGLVRLKLILHIFSVYYICRPLLVFGCLAIIHIKKDECVCCLFNLIFVFSCVVMLPWTKYFFLIIYHNYSLI